MIQKELVFLILLLFVIFTTKRWLKEYKEKNIPEVKSIDIRTYSQFFRSYTKRVYYGCIFLLIIFIVRVVYDILINYCL